LRGGRNSTGRGFAVYVNKNGKKVAIRQLARGKVESVPAARNLSEIRLSAAKIPDSAKRKFLTARTNKVAYGVISKIPKSRMLTKKEKFEVGGAATKFHKVIKTERIDFESATVKKLARELKTAIKDSASIRRFILVTIGVTLHDKKTGQRFFVSIQEKLPNDLQFKNKREIDTARLEHFFGKSIYAAVSKRLGEMDYVLAGSAANIKRKKINKGKARRNWRSPKVGKNGEISKTFGFIWEGNDRQDCEIEQIEYRFDKQHFDK